MKSCGDQIFTAFEKVCSIAHGRQAPQLLEKSSGRLDRSATTNKTKHFANSRIHRYLHPAFGIFSDKAAELIDFDKGARVRLRLMGC